MLLNNLFQKEKEINANEAVQKKNRVMGLIASVLGGLILLCVNLITSRRAKDE